MFWILPTLANINLVCIAYLANCGTIDAEDFSDIGLIQCLVGF